MPIQHIKRSVLISHCGVTVDCFRNENTDGERQDPVLCCKSLLSRKLYVDSKDVGEDSDAEKHSRYSLDVVLDQ